MRLEFYRNSQRLNVINLYTLKGTANETEVKQSRDVDDNFNKVLDKLKYRVRRIQPTELVSLFEITAKKDKFYNFLEFSDKVDEIDSTVELIEKKLIYSKLDPHREQRLSAK